MQALHSAVQSGHLAVVRYLIERGCGDARASTIRGVRPLHWVAAHLPLAQYLVRARAEPRATADDGVTPVQVAASSGNPALLAYLTEVSLRRGPAALGSVQGELSKLSAAKTGDGVAAMEEGMRTSDAIELASGLDPSSSCSSAAAAAIMDGEEERPAKMASYVLLTVLAGRRDRLQLLVRYLDRLVEGKDLDEVHLWDFARTAEDKEFRGSLTAAFLCS